MIIIAVQCPEPEQAFQKQGMPHSGRLASRTGI
jgi:hypothetical protein